MRGGWVKTYRSLQSSAIWLSDQPFCDRAAWMDLILLANYEDGVAHRGNRVVPVKRGQILTSIASLSRRWRWGKDKTRAYLDRLTADDMIYRISDNSKTLITIVNYEFYQGDEEANPTTDQHTSKSIEPAIQPRYISRCANACKPSEISVSGCSHERKTLDTSDPLKNIYIYNTDISNLTDITDLDSVSNSDKITDKDNVSNLDNINNIDIGTNTNKSITNKDSVNKYSEEAKQIIEYLNQKAGKHFRPESKSTTKMVVARLKEKYTVDDFKRVIDNKVEAWGDDAKMRDYLRPETLFAPSHFESYLNEKRKEKVKDEFGWWS